MTYPTFNWGELANELGLLQASGESSGSSEAQRALELILGPDTLRGAVDYYVTHAEGSELARSVLWYSTLGAQ